MRNRKANVMPSPTGIRPARYALKQNADGDAIIIEATMRALALAGNSQTIGDNLK